MKEYLLTDIVAWAIKIEQQGELFYEKACGYTDDSEIKKLFMYLKSEEVKHIRRFNRLGNSFRKSNAFFSVDTRFEDLLDAFMRGMAFFDVSEIRDKIARRKDRNTQDLLRLAMDIELNTILFYRTIDEYAKSGPVRKALKTIIHEEEAHLVKLKGVRKEKDPLYGEFRPLL
ncbi:MAG: ferritin family protein [Candidatus Omnitrophica bacterium]|nr:ferritin family protein [Candidatus Omnitrophota bacterium]